MNRVKSLIVSQEVYRLGQIGTRFIPGIVMLFNLRPVIEYRVNPQQRNNPVKKNDVRLAKRKTEPCDSTPKQAKRQPVFSIKGSVAVAKIMPRWVEGERLDEPDEKEIRVALGQAVHPVIDRSLIPVAHEISVVIQVFALVITHRLQKRPGVKKLQAMVETSRLKQVVV